MTRVAFNASGSPIEYQVKFGHYEVMDIIGKGSFGVIAHAYDRYNKRDVAVKMVSRNFLNETGRLFDFEQELRVMQSLYLKGIVKIYDIVYQPDNIYVVMEYCKYGDLLMFNEDEPQLAGKYLKKILSQVINTIASLHSRNIAHLDIKPDNIMIDEDFNAKLGDFGCCQTILDHGSFKFGTLYYLAPELIQKTAIDVKLADIWAFGIVLYVMYQGSIPWTGETDEDVTASILYGILPYETVMGVELERLFIKCCNRDPELRPSAQEVANDPFFSDDYPIIKSARKTSNETYTGKLVINAITKSRYHKQITMSRSADSQNIIRRPIIKSKSNRLSV